MSEAKQWNKPTENGEKPRSERRVSPFAHGLIAALLVVIGVGGYMLVFQGEKDGVAPMKSVSGPGMIREQKPSIAPKPEPKEVGVEKAVDPNARPTKVGEVVNGYVMLPSGRIHRRLGIVTNSAANRPKGAYHIFECPTDNEIACYLTLKPGEALVGTPRYNGRFKKQFLESLKTPITVTSDDTPEQAKLKREVIQAREELKAALDRGEDIERIMLDTREELQDLMRYKMEIKSMFDEARLNACETEQDIDDLLSACNKMLESRSIAPMKFGPLTRRNLMSQKGKVDNK